MLISQLIGSYLVISLAGASTPASLTPEALNDAKVQLVKRLQARNFFLAGACGEILETALTRLKLPPVGSNLYGRENNNRKGEYKDRPEMHDQKRLKSDDWDSIALNTEARGANEWTAQITRAKDNDKTFESLFTFSTKQNGDRLECDLKDVRFTLKTKQGSETATSDDCLDPLVIDQSNATDQAVVTTIQRDCIFALRYSNRARLFSAKGKAK